MFNIYILIISIKAEDIMETDKFNGLPTGSQTKELFTIIKVS